MKYYAITVRLTQLSYRTVLVKAHNMQDALTAINKTVTVMDVNEVLMPGGGGVLEAVLRKG